MPMSNYPDPNDTALPPPPPRCGTGHDSTTMPILSSSPRQKEEPDDKIRRRRKDYDRDSIDKLPRSSKHKYSSSSSLGDRKVSSGSVRRRSTSRERRFDYDDDFIRDKARASPNSDRSGKPTPDMDRRDSAEERTRGSYPTFSKAHSREAVGSREQISVVSEEQERRRNSTPPENGDTKIESPAERVSASRARSRSDMRDQVLRPKTAPREEDGKTRTAFAAAARGVKQSASGGSLRRDAHLGASEVSSMPGAFPDEVELKSTPASSFRRTVSTNSQPASTLTQNTEESIDSQATSVAADRKYTRTAPPIMPVTNGSSPQSATDSLPKTPTPSEPYFPPAAKATPVYDVGGGWESMESGRTPTMSMPPPPPPPPPPPMAAQAAIPRVDYLLKHGGLPYAISRRLVQSSGPSPAQQYSVYNSPQLAQVAPPEEYQRVFSGLTKRLDDYMQVLHSNGSIAVATGYRSVARRLLDKLSQVFARDISSQRCDCVICKTTPQPDISDEEDTGVSWGEILEFVSGRRDLPQWPPFIIQPSENGHDLGAAEVPMQKIDIDVPEEYREHYKRQNQKTKLAVQSWLEQQPIVPSSPPEEADEDTLMFAMMTKLNMQERNLFIALMHGQTSISDMRAPTPAERPTTSSTLKRTRRALQRLYRLERAPRDCECAMYLLNNTALHGMLATLAEVNEQEWDILISGRFDGFLWSGAETNSAPYASPAISRMPSRNMNASPLSRNMTPFSGLSGVPSRGPTPFGSSPLRNVMSPDAFAFQQTLPSRMQTPALGYGSGGAPVQLDEETEVAVLAELERNILQDMERLEDAFEMLHNRAENVRGLLRERAAGLGIQAQLRRGSLGYDPGVRLDTPASGFTNFDEDEDDDGLGDTASLAPDDSASQISYNRRVRKRRERQTPAPVEEEDEPELGASDKERIREREARRRDGRRSVPRR